MGMIRKATSVSTLGLVKYRSNKEQEAKTNKDLMKEEKKRTKIMEEQAKRASDQPDTGDADVTVKLAELATLHQAGALTDEEFAAAKAKLLD